MIKNVIRIYYEKLIYSNIVRVGKITCCSQFSHSTLHFPHINSGFQVQQQLPTSPETSCGFYIEIVGYAYFFHSYLDLIIKEQRYFEKENKLELNCFKMLKYSYMCVLIYTYTNIQNRYIHYIQNFRVLKPTSRIEEGI